jgi:alkylation response protein AidB-like acyl-CoA dehydrogenase
VNFDLSDDQHAQQEAVRAVLAAEFPLPAVHAFADATAEAGAYGRLWASLMSLGLAAMPVPEEHGGLGLAVLDLAAVAEELGYGLAPGPFMSHLLATLAVARGGSSEQQKAWLPGLVTGEHRAALAWRAGTLGLLAEAGTDLLVIPESGGLSVIEAAADAGPAIAGIDRTRPLTRVPQDALRSGPAAQPLARGVEVTGLVAAAAQVLLAADSYGAARRCLELTVSYAKTRHQWGRPIGQFQAVKHQLADLALMVEPSRGLHWYAAHALDTGLPDAMGAAALAKLHTSERAVDVTRAAVELHGGIGYTWECDVHLFLKRALLNRVYHGEPDSLRRIVAAASGW